MSEQINLRMLVMEMLLQVSAKEAYSHVIVREVLNKHDYLSTKEKAFVKRLFEGTLERQIELDYCINQFSKVKVNKMKPVIRTIMRMGAYQILYMESVPDSAACNEAVKLAGKKGFTNLKGFVNGVLRNIARGKEDIVYPEDLSIKYSMPEWIISLWEKAYDKATIEKILQGLLEEHPVTIRLRDKKKIDEIKLAVEKNDGSVVKHPYFEDAYLLEGTDNIRSLPGFDEGAFVIQDVSSMLAVKCLGIKKDSLVIDICAAPGGKSMLAGDYLMGTGKVLARDVSIQKVSIMDENFERCNLDNVTASVQDACEEDEEYAGKADFVIADIPCSGLGIMGKKRDIKYNISEEAIASIVKLQEDILEQAVKLLKTGGRLLFSTCTINREENEEHVTLLSQKYKLKPVSLDEYLPEELRGETTKNGYLQLLPGIHEADGFFISVFEK